jgi:hypothetical protein
VARAGTGSGPDLRVEAAPSAATALPEPFGRAWGGYQDFLSYAITQERAFSSQPWYGRLTRQEIVLGGVTLAACEPLEGEVRSAAMARYVGDGAKVVCFRVAAVDFRLTGEHHEQREDATPPR